MNKKDRQALATARRMMEQAYEIINQVQEDEQNKYDNLSEGLQQSERGQKFEENATDLETMCDELQQSIDKLADMENEE